MEIPTDNAYIKYTDYSVEKLAQDDFFIFSIVHPTEETNSFWLKTIELGIVNKDDYNLARYFVESMQVSPRIIQQDEIFSLWEDIEIANKINLRRKRKHFTLYFSIAASIAVLFAFAYFSQILPDDPETDIFSFNIEEVKAPDVQISDIQLVLANNETVSLEGEDAQIIYNQDRIAINNDEKLLDKEKIDTSQNNFNQLIVPLGKRSVLTFAEGSKVWLNAGTRIVYPAVFQEHKREIYIDGEAFLEVSRNEDSPFIVKTNKMHVEVLGTSFNVTAYDKDTTQNIVLVSGSVKINSDNKELILSPNQMYSLRNGQSEVLAVDVEDYISWRHGIYRYESENLSNILKRLSRYYGQEIEYAKEVSHLKCSGKLDLKDELQVVLEGISLTAPVIYHNENGVHLITSKNKSL